MKLYFYINVLGGGGAERVVANLANQFQEHGHDVGIITSFKVENEYKTNYEIQRYNLEKRANDKNNRLLKNINRIHKLRRVLKSEKPDVIIAFMAEPNFRTIVAGLGLRTKIVTSVRNDPNKEYAGHLGNFVKQIIMPLSDGCVFQTTDAQQAFSKTLIDKSVIILNQVDSKFFTVRRHPKYQKIVTAGRLSAQKNQKLLINAFSRIYMFHPLATLHIYGDGVLKEELENLIKELNLSEKVFLHGNTSHMESVYSEADLFVLSSNYEGLPNALLEAMACGVACISTDCPCGGPRMVIEDGINGLLTPVDDVEQMAAAIDELLRDDAKKNQFSMKGKETSVDLLNPEIIYSKWEKYLYSIIGE